MISDLAENCGFEVIDISGCQRAASQIEVISGVRRSSAISDLPKTVDLNVIAENDHMISDCELRQQFFEGRKDDLAIMHGCGIAHLRIL